MSYDIQTARDLVANIKSGADGLNALTAEITKKAREYTISKEKYIELLNFNSKFYNYSINNVILIRMQNPNATYVGSFKHFKALNYSVKKGEHGMKILVPVKVKFIKDRDGNIKKLTEATKEEKIKALNKEIPVYEKTYFKPGTIFDISQTDCPTEDLPKYLGYMEEKRDSKIQYQCLYDIVKNHGISISVEDLKSVSLKGYYQPANDNICLNNRLNAANRVKTLTHEFAHALLHKNCKDEPKAKIEFEAESVAYMALKQIGVDLSDYSFDYIGSYFQNLKDFSDKDLNDSLKRISNTAKYITNLYKDNIEDYSCNQEEQPDSTENMVEISPFKHLKKEDINEESPFI